MCCVFCVHVTTNFLSESDKFTEPRHKIGTALFSASSTDQNSLDDVRNITKPMTMGSGTTKWWKFNFKMQ